MHYLIIVYRRITLPSCRPAKMSFKSIRGGQYSSFGSSRFKYLSHFGDVLACFGPVWASFGLKHFFNLSAFWAQIMVSNLRSPKIINKTRRQCDYTVDLSSRQHLRVRDVARDGGVTTTK
jgi:hypothetical protein